MARSPTPRQLDFWDVCSHCKGLCSGTYTFEWPLVQVAIDRPTLDARIDAVIAASFEGREHTYAALPAFFRHYHEISGVFESDRGRVDGQDMRAAVEMMATVHPEDEPETARSRVERCLRGLLEQLDADEQLILDIF